MKISPRKRVELALQKKEVDKIPFTAYGSFWGQAGPHNPTIPERSSMIPQCATERALRNKGLCIVNISYFGHACISPNAKVASTVYEENGNLKIRTEYTTPAGTLYSVKEVREFTIWVEKHLFTSREDYKAVLSLIGII